MKRTSDIYRFNVRSSLALGAATLVSIGGFLWPFLFNAAGNQSRTQLFFWISVPLALALLIVELSNDRLDAKSVALLVVLAAITAALRPMGAGAVGIEPMWFILILSARVFGAAFGFILGISALLVSAFLTGGFGPWLAYQMFAAGWVGLGAGALPQRIGRFALRGKSEILLLLFYGAIAALIFGALMDLQFWPWALGANTQLSYLPGGPSATNLHRFIVFHFASSMAWDVPRAFITSALVVIAGPTVLSALRRTQRRAAFLAPIEFREASQNAIERVRAQKEL